jgi:hypothetical protein
MDAKRFRGRAWACAVLLGVASPMPVAGQTPLVFGTWHLFEWFLGVGPVEGKGFTVDAPGQVRVRVVDVGVSGDAFDVSVNPLFSSPSVVGGIDTGIFDGDGAWAEPALSKVQFLLGPGRHELSIAVREIGSGFDFGEGLIRVDRVVPTAVPEPTSLALLGGALAGLAALAPVARRARRRSR